MNKKPYLIMSIIGAVEYVFLYGIFALFAYLQYLVYLHTTIDKLQNQFGTIFVVLIGFVMVIFMIVSAIAIGAGCGVLWIKLVLRKDKNKKIETKHYVYGALLMPLLLSVVINPLACVCQIFLYVIPILAIILYSKGDGIPTTVGSSAGGASGGGGRNNSNSTTSVISSEPIIHGSPKVCPFYEGRSSVGFSDICHAVRGKDTVTYEMYKKYCQWNCFACPRYQDNQKYYKQRF
jgi:hypothetical protein